MNTIITPDNLAFYYEGPPMDYGRLPSFFYFALSGKQSLYTPPYNSPILPFQNQACRIFSATLPSHGESPSELTAIKEWGESIQAGDYPLEDFIHLASQGIQWLIDEGYVLEDKIALGGLSRGGFIATHLAAKLPKVRNLLCFAPLTELNHVEEFKAYKDNPSFQRRIDSLNLSHVIDHLTHLHNVRFYIGNRDTRVNTDACYHFIKNLTEKMHQIHSRHSHIELFITQSIGFKGHGTSPHTFEEGSLWLKHKLLEA